MRTPRWLIVGIIVALCGVTAQAKQPEAPDPDPLMGAIAVKVKVKGPTAISAPSQARRVFLVKIDDGVDPLRAEQVIASNFERKKQVFLLNAEPGTYVAIGVFADSNALNVPSSNVYFDEKTIRATEVTVEPGKWAFMGDITVKVKVGMKKADAAQNHYGDMIGRGIRMAGGVSANVSTGGTTSYIGVGHVTRAGSMVTIDRSPATAATFWTKAADKTFAKQPAWQELARNQTTAAE